MATTLTSTTWTMQITSSATINGINRGCSWTITVPTVSYHDVRTMAIPTAAEIDILTFVAAGTAIGSGKFTDTTVRYLMIRNLDDTNFVRMRLIDTGGKTIDVKIPAKQVVILSSLSLSGSSIGAAFASFVFPDNCILQADTAAVDIEYELVVGV